MPICPECDTGFEDESHCPKCGAISPVETWPRPSAGPPPEYGTTALFCLRLTQIFSFIAILWTAVVFLFSLFDWNGFLRFLFSLVAVPSSIGLFYVVSIAIRYAEEKNGAR